MSSSDSKNGRAKTWSQAIGAMSPDEIADWQHSMLAEGILPETFSYGSGPNRSSVRYDRERNVVIERTPEGVENVLSLEGGQLHRTPVGTEAAGADRRVPVRGYYFGRYSRPTKKKASRLPDGEAVDVTPPKAPM